ncbi:hypothetical protein BKA62DRAFT_72691 [Auriculariales sp. MPI-PUGE-AT-0066]|nr:hypothetical protein BKA62DRAFT_72691 [Auriculariales sp. MPI-PUGE-AT-0066]
MLQELSNRWDELHTMLDASRGPGSMKHLAALEEQLRMLKARIERQRNIQQPANKMPTEILVEIFKEACRDWDSTVVILRQVCSHWRSVTTSCASLWQSFNSEFFKDPVRALDEYLDRAGDRSLRLTFIFYDESEDDIDRGKIELIDRQLVTALLAKLPAISPRITELNIHLHEHSRAGPELVAALAQPCPLLESLFIRVMKSTAGSLLMPSFPSGFGMSTNLPLILDPDFCNSLASLTSLALQNVSISQVPPCTSLAKLWLTGCQRLNADMVSSLCGKNKGLEALCVSKFSTPQGKLYRWQVPALLDLCLDDVDMPMLTAVHRRVDFRRIRSISLDLLVACHRPATDPLAISYIFSSMARVEVMVLHACRHGMEITLRSSSRNRSLRTAIEHFSHSFKSILEQIALDYRLFAHATEVSVTPCQWTNLAEVSSDAPFHRLRVLKIDLFHCTMHATKHHSLAGNSRFDWSHYALTSTKLQCPNLAEVVFDRTVHGEVVLEAADLHHVEALLDLIDIGVGRRLEKIRFADSDIPDAWKTALQNRADALTWWTAPNLGTSD